MAAGADPIKEALAKLGLKTGGTLRQRAERLFLTRDVPLAELDKKHFAKGAAPVSLLSREERDRHSTMVLEAALLEAKVRTDRQHRRMSEQTSQPSWRSCRRAVSVGM